MVTTSFRSSLLALGAPSKGITLLDGARTPTERRKARDQIEPSLELRRLRTGGPPPPAGSFELRLRRRRIGGERGFADGLSTL